jgi:hypothetical protein
LEGSFGRGIGVVNAGKERRKIVDFTIKNKFKGIFTSTSNNLSMLNPL